MSGPIQTHLVWKPGGKGVQLNSGEPKTNGEVTIPSAGRPEDGEQIKVYLDLALDPKSRQHVRVKRVSLLKQSNPRSTPPITSTKFQDSEMR